jgi:hypothetical protein
MTKVRSVVKQEHSFTLVLSGAKSLDDLEAGIYGAGCDDALIGMRCGIPYVTFDREAKSLFAAIQSAIQDVKKAGFQVARIEPDDLVSMSEIARRAKRSRESVSKYVKGQRQAGGFPAPISGVTANAMRWRWSEVARWLADKGQLEAAPAHDAALVSRLNAALELRRLTASESELQKVLQLAK